MSEMRTFRVFVSSPGDVTDERSRAHQILAILPQEPAWRDKISIDVVRWDNPHSPTPMYANLTPQEAVNRNLPKPSECDLVVLILWGRFGTPLIEPLRPDGSHFQSGTEWEYDDALRGKVPILLYRRMSDPQVSLRDPEYAEKKRQLELVDAFFKRFSDSGGAATGGYILYDDPDDFEDKFKHIIESAIRQLLEAKTNFTSRSLNPEVSSSPLTSSVMAIIDRLTREIEEQRKEIVSLKQTLILKNPSPERQPHISAEHPSKSGTELVEPAFIQVEKARDSAEVQQDPAVLAIAPVIPMKLIAPFGDPDMPLAMSGNTWGVSAVGADTSTFSGNGVVVALIDTGIDAKHPAFAGLNIIERDFSGEGNGDRDGHGTHFAGTVFGRSVNGIRIGVAPGVRQALIAKAIGARRNKRSVASRVPVGDATACRNHCTIVALRPCYASTRITPIGSEEIAELKSWQAMHSNARIFESLVAMATIRGIPSWHSLLIVAAAGNDSRRDGNPTAVVDVSSPADTDGVISVAALGQAATGLTISSFSNRGATLCAPGARILSARAGGGLISFSGTSMAAAHVVGAAALWAEKLKAVNRTASLGPHLYGSASRDPLQPGFDPSDVGHGVVRAPQS